MPCVAGSQKFNVGVFAFQGMVRSTCMVVISRHAERGGAEGVIARRPGDTEGPWVQNCQNRMQNYGLRTPLVYLGGAIVLCTPPFDSAF